MSKSNLDWRNSCLFVLADIGDVHLFSYWLNKKKLNIDVQDEDGDTSLHHAARKGHIDLVIELLKRGAVISSNKKKRTALLEAYDSKQPRVANEITKIVIQRNSIKNIPIQKSTKIDNQEQARLDQLVSDFIQHLRKNYLARNMFRFPARHILRANALIIAARRCNSIKKFKDLLNNQLNLCRGNPASPISEHIIDKRWSKVMKNKYNDPNKSLYYKTMYAFVVEKLSNNLNTSSVRGASHR